MSKSEDTQKSDKAPKIIHEELMVRPHGFPAYSTLYMDDGTTVHNEFTLYRDNKVKVIGHDTGYFYKYFAGFGFE